jgi:hypothetical protein
MTRARHESARATGGAYNVKEDVLEFEHMPQDLPTPKDGDEFLARFR